MLKLFWGWQTCFLDLNRELNKNGLRIIAPGAFDELNELYELWVSLSTFVEVVISACTAVIVGAICTVECES